MKNFILFLTIFAFIIEPMALMPKAQASGAQCKQGPENTKKGCSENPAMQQAQQDTGRIKDQTQKAKDGSGDRVRDMFMGALGEGNKNKAAMQQAMAQCSEAAEQCSSACDQEIGRKKSLQQDTSQEEQAKADCKQEEKESQAKSEGGMKELMALIQAIMGLIASLKGNKEDEKKDEVAEAEEEDVCKTPEGAFLIDCQCEESQKVDGKCPIKTKSTGSRLGGSTGILAGGAALGVNEARPASAEFDSKLNDNAGAGGISKASAASSGAPGFNTGSTPSLNGEGGAGVDQGVDTNIGKGFHSSSGGGGGGFGSFGGGGGAKSSGFKGYGSSRNSVASSAKKAALNKKLKAATAGRRPASFNGGRTGGPFGDNFYTIKKAYKKQKSSMYHHNQQ